MFHLIPQSTKIDFANKRHLWLGVSITLLIGTVVLWNTKGLNYGIDFDGGAEVQVLMPSSWDIGKLRSALDKGGVKDARVQRLGEDASGEFLIRAAGDEKEIAAVAGQVQRILSETLKEGSDYKILKSDVVGAAAGSTLRKKAFLSVFYALLVILIYVAIRFDSRYAPGAVMALFHDATLTIGALIVLGVQFDLTVLAAILALVGYSNNDTIIVYDRVRETLHLRPNLKIEDAVNLSINETLNRTIVTSLSTFIVSFSLFLFGGPVIRGFATTFTIGLVIGTYSSIFIASSMLIEIAKYQQRRSKEVKSNPKKKRRTYEVPPDPSSSMGNM